MILSSKVCRYNTLAEDILDPTLSHVDEILRIQCAIPAALEVNVWHAFKPSFIVA